MKDFVINLLLKSGAVQTDKAPYKLKAGGESDYYVDIRMAVSQPRILRTLAALFTWDSIPPDCWAGVAVGGVPLAVACSLATDTPCLIVRPEAKDHGTKKRVEGRISYDYTGVVLLEDVATTGGSAANAIDALVEVGLRVTDLWVVVDREQGAQDVVSKYNIGFRALVTGSEIMTHVRRSL